MVRIALMLTVAGVLGACTTQPTVTKQRMTLAEANIQGMECRDEKPIGTNFGRTVCASPEAWKKFDAAARYENDLAFQKARTTANAGPFNRQ